jgi:hypothetical protein
MFLPFQLLKLVTDFPQFGMDILAAGRNIVAEARRMCKYSVFKAVFVQFGTQEVTADI